MFVSPLAYILEEIKDCIMTLLQLLMMMCNKGDGINLGIELMCSVSTDQPFVIL